VRHALDEERPAVKTDHLDNTTKRPMEVVKAGDTLTHIIRRIYGRYDEATLKAILRDNPEIQDPDLIQVGQLIRLPR
jgi:nucleoid-associated protein YgaU